MRTKSEPAQSQRDNALPPKRPPAPSVERPTRAKPTLDRSGPHARRRTGESPTATSAAGPSNGGATDCPPFHRKGGFIKLTWRRPEPKLVGRDLLW